MYKTVRHGENSLQYKILSQQEEGIINFNVKCRKTKKRKIAGVIVIVVFLVCGIIASAVLIPLVLANDFITLTGTFQKFSVSTLRRTHTGNHVVVIAKKPHGWIGSRQSVLPNASAPTTHLSSKENTTEKLPGTKNPQRAFNSSSELKTSSNLQQGTPNASSPYTTPTKSHTFEYLPHSTENSKDSFTEATTLSEVIPTRAPFPDSRKKWTFDASTNFISSIKTGVFDHPVLTASGALIVVVFITLAFALLLKNTREKRKLKEKDSADQNEDKTKLLKSPTRGSDEE